MSEDLAEDLFGDEAETVTQSQATESATQQPALDVSMVDSAEPSQAHTPADDAADLDLFGDEEEQVGEAAATGTGFVVPDEDGEEGEGDGEQAEPEVDVKAFTVPLVQRPRGMPLIPGTDKDQDLVLTKLPNFLRIAADAYDPEQLVNEIQADIDSGDLSGHEQIRRKTLRVDNTLRWKEPDDEEAATRSSNARFVRWSDGSLSLQVGEEMFDCRIKSIPSEHNYLTLMHPEEGLLRMQGKFATSLSILPSGLASKSHADLKADIARRQQSSKNRGVKEFNTSADPEALSRNAAKAEADRIKARKRLETQKQRALGRSGDGRMGSRLTAAALDDNSDEELGVGNRRNLDRYDDDDGFIENDEDEEEEEAGAERLQALKSKGAEAYASRKRKVSEDPLDRAEAALEGERAGRSSEEEAAEMTDKDEPKKQEEQSKKKARRLIFDSDDDDE
ncbi:Leo1-like protein-domain-containing protein [Protomyces lactucae-debilis]|uniref:Leo1-like protein-domain-containing protein n=1 Tax=Protomyces lactucae-debilis TaxID=2754530 RepID=A0A1Y2F4B1_PROLT|nr:Leo1-like protein-domain-containing protein [Protomyces lactucae-debilis]ORY78527.1 Leo1-like protein-domain-containing protein [Protomyces lactucae-debilis]